MCGSFAQMRRTVGPGPTVHGASPVLLVVVHELQRIGRKRC
ncbi:unnamed protein product [Ectocarpus sp. 4 AP-2014]